MADFWMNFAIEIGFLSLLGVMYYFWQKRRLIRFEENKIPMVMSYILQACLSEKTETSQPMLDSVIEALDDFLSNKTQTAPLALLKTFTASSECSPELKNLIDEGLKEIG